MSINATNDVTVTITVSSQVSAEALHRIINYGLNNMPSVELPVGESLDQIKYVRTQLASVFD